MNKAKYAVIIVTALLVSIFGMGRMPQLIVITGLGAGCVYLIMRRTDKDMRIKIAILFLATFILQIAISLFLYNKTVDTEDCGFSHRGDDYSYGNFGMIVGDLWRKGIFPNLKELDYYNVIAVQGGVQNYQLYNAFIFYLFSFFAGQILLVINCFLHAAIIVPVYFICKDLNIKKGVMTFLFFLFLLWPSTFYWSLFNFKEPAILFLLFATLALFIKPRESPSFINIFFLVIFASATYLFRRYFFILFPIVVLYFCIFSKWKYKNVIILASLLFFGLLELGTGIFSGLLAKVGNLPEKLFNTRFASDEASSSYFINFETLTYPKTALYFPLGVMATLFLPFLLKPFTLFQAGSNIESLIWWCFIPFLAGGIWIAIRENLKKTFLILSTFFCWLSMLAVTQGNMGTLIRQKSIIYYIGFIFIGLGIDRALKSIKNAPVTLNGNGDDARIGNGNGDVNGTEQKNNEF